MNVTINFYLFYFFKNFLERFVVTSAIGMFEKSKTLKQGKLNLIRKTNLNKKYPDGLEITSLGFHPSAKIAFTSSLSKRLNIFQVNFNSLFLYQ